MGRESHLDESKVVIRMKDIVKKFGDFTANDQINLTVHKGEVHAILGENGAGKSTAFKAILGLIHVDDGTVRVMGQDSTGLTPAQKEEIGVVLSDSTFSGYLTVQQISHIMEKMYHRFDRADFLEKCHQLSIPLDRSLKEFSTGMRAKLKVLLALSHEAKLLILDEPTAGLDVVARDQILDLLREYMEQEGRGILISSHISSDLEGLCDDLYMIHEGKIILHEDMDVLLDQYGILKVEEKVFADLDKRGILRVAKESWGYSCLTNEKQFYLENYPGLIVERGSVDEIITMISKGEKL